MKRLLPLGLCALALAARLIPGPRTIDDAFITFRYARNLVAGLGFVYNPGEHVLGTTTPLYTLVLAGLARLLGTGAYPEMALILNALFEGASVFLLYHLGRALSGSRIFGAALGLLWAISPMGVTFAIGGMETPLVTFLLIATFHAYIVNRSRLAAALGGMATLTRPDALLAPALALLDATWRRRQLPWAEAALFLAVVAPWLAFADWYFGSPLSHSVVAKSVAYHLPPAAAFVNWLQQLSVPFFEHQAIPNYPPLAGLIVYGTLYLIGARDLVRRCPRSLPVLMYPAAYIAAFSLANPLIFRWYWVPPLPFYFLGILAGVWALLRDVLSLTRRATALSRPAFVAVALLFAALSLNAWTLHPDHGPDRPAPDMAFTRLENLYAAAATTLNAGLRQSQVVAAGDIGILGYTTGARILDTLGLVSPEASRYYPLPPEAYVGNYAVAPALIAEQRPDYVVILEAYGRNTLLADPAFNADYRLVHRWDDPVVDRLYASKGLLMYARR